MSALGTDFGFFFQSAGFDISHAPLAFASTDTYALAFAVGLVNTLMMAALAGAGALLVGVFVGVGSTVGNGVSRAGLLGFVGLMRNLPKLLVLLAVYVALLQSLPSPKTPWGWAETVFLSNRGLSFPVYDWTMGAWDVPSMSRFGLSGGMLIPMQFLALWFTLVIYHGAQVGEIVRGGLQSIPKGQWEAASALGLSTAVAIRRVILPQVFRQIMPSLISQTINLFKNTSIGLAVGFVDLMSVASTTINQAFKPIEVMVVVMLLYLFIGLLLSTCMNLLNHRLRKGWA